MTTPATLTRTARLTADVDQLTRPIHVAIRGRVVTHPCLLDQLRDAATPSRAAATGPARRAPASRPPVRLDAIDHLSAVYVGISIWHGRLSLPSPPRDTDWQKAVLRSFVGVAPNLSPAIADYLADEVHDWWCIAATTSGWRTEHLHKLR